MTQKQGRFKTSLHQAGTMIVATKSIQVTSLLLLLLCASGFPIISGLTDPLDVAVLRALMDQLKNTPPSWGQDGDPCGTPWEGVGCNGTRVTRLCLTTTRLTGTLSGDIGSLNGAANTVSLSQKFASTSSCLSTLHLNLDLSFNQNLSGPITPSIGNLKELAALILVGCSFTGSIPQELGNLPKLSFLVLGSNQLSGMIPASLGKLSNLYWLDLSDNHLTGQLPVSADNSPGLDLLVNARHFRLSKNQLSGPLPEKLFSSDMSLIQLLLQENKFSGSIPATTGLLQSLEVLRLDKNVFGGKVPRSICNLTQLYELNLANNMLTGEVPDLSAMSFLQYVDLSNNSFDASEAPSWFSSMHLATIVIESGGLKGQVPMQLFSSPKLQTVNLKNNNFNGTLDMGNNISKWLLVVDLQNNNITSLVLSAGYNNTLTLAGNPLCSSLPSNVSFCAPDNHR